MTSTRKLAALTLVAAGIGAATLAIAHGPGWGPGYGQGPGAGYGPGGCANGPAMMQGYGPGMMGPGMGPGMMYGPRGGAPSAEDFGKFQDQRLATLKERLGITTEQEAAWTSFATQAKEHRPATMGPPPAATGPDAYTARIERMKERTAAMEKMQGAYKGLYEVLTPAQREVLGSGMGMGYGPRWGGNS